MRVPYEIKLISRTWWMFPQMSWLKIKIKKKKMRHYGFVDKRTTITMALISSSHWKTFCLRKKTWKRIFNTSSELSQNHTEKQIMPFKTIVNWLFNDIWSSLAIDTFDWKIGVFQQTVVGVYYILNSLCLYLGRREKINFKN